LENKSTTLTLYPLLSFISINLRTCKIGREKRAYELKIGRGKKKLVKKS
jgi:hypothetical protein